MRQRICLTLLFILFLAPCSFSQSDPFDLVVIGAHVVDGSDNPWYLADVGVRGGGRNRIKAGQSVDRFLLHFRLEAGPRTIYGSTCTVASLVTNRIGRCCEFLALTCTIDRVPVPGASPLITMPMIVPVPLAPAVFG